MPTKVWGEKSPRVHCACVEGPSADRGECISSASSAAASDTGAAAAPAAGGGKVVGKKGGYGYVGEEGGGLADCPTEGNLLPRAPNRNSSQDSVHTYVSACSRVLAGV